MGSFIEEYKILEKKYPNYIIAMRADDGIFYDIIDDNAQKVSKATWDVPKSLDYGIGRGVPTLSISVTFIEEYVKSVSRLTGLKFIIAGSSRNYKFYSEKEGN